MRLALLTPSLALLALCSLLGCSRAVHPAVIDDARTTARVRTAIVNDAQFGGRPIDVRVVRGVAELSGQVASQDEARRITALVQSVPGVTSVHSTLQVIGQPGAPNAAPVREARILQTEPIDEGDDPRILALGASASWTLPTPAPLAGGVSVGPLVRFGSGTGLSPTIDFNWFTFDYYSGPDRTRRLATVNVRPVMAGLGYRVAGPRLSAEFSLVGGVSFNGLRPVEETGGSRVPLRADRSLAWRPGVSIWYDLNRHVAFNAFFGYVVVRPSVLYLEGGRTETRTLRADTMLFTGGIAYKLF